MGMFTNIHLCQLLLNSRGKSRRRQLVLASAIHSVLDKLAGFSGISEENVSGCVLQ